MHTAMEERDIVAGGHDHKAQQLKVEIGTCAMLKKNPLAHDAEQFFLQNELPLLIFLAALVGLIVLPTHGLFALPAGDVADDVATGRHTALDGIGLGDVHDGVEEVSLAMLTAEVLVASRYRVSRFEVKIERGWQGCFDDLMKECSLD